jgi:hypothetical protein
MNVAELGLVGLLFLPAFPPMPSTDSIIARRAMTSAEGDSDDERVLDGSMAVGCRALARGLKMHSILLFLHLRQGPPCTGSHFICTA